jgi:hypothetical protein
LIFESGHVIVNVCDRTQSEIEFGRDLNLVVFVFGALNGTNVLRFKAGVKIKVFDSFDADEFVLFPEKKWDWIGLFDSSTACAHGHVVAGTLFNVKNYL